MSLFPVVSQLDAVDANYLTIKTAEGFLVHYHDLQRLQEPAPYDLDGGNHAKTSSWNQIVRSPHRVAAFRSTTARLLPDPEGRIKSNFSRISENRKGLSFGSSTSSGVIADHWRRTRGAATTEALGPGCYETPERDRFGNRIEGEIGSRAPRARSRRSTDGRLDAFHAPPRNRGTAAFAARTHRKQPAGRMAASGGNRGDRGTGKNKMNWTI